MDHQGALTVRRASTTDWSALARIDSVGTEARGADIRRWCEQGLVLMAEDDAQRALGYLTLEYTFFEQGFVSMLMVASGARRRGVGVRLLEAAEAECTAPKLFTSTNVSNHPMQQLLQKAGWSPVGLLHGLDEGDPELFYLSPTRGSRSGVVIG
jgi:GNAT superfamily N-acetyltransferase